MPQLDKNTQEILDSELQYRIEDNKDKQTKKDVIENDIPQYKTKLELSESDIERITVQVFDEYEALQDERKDLQLESKWKQLDAQYDGQLQENKKLRFNVHVPQSKIKSDAIVRALNESTLDSDPIVDVSPRPGEFKRVGQEDCDKQTQFIDFAFDEEIKPEQSITLINKSAVNKFVGIGKIEWVYQKERRKREEIYEGKVEVIGVDAQGNPITENKALKEFISNYPDAVTRYPAYVKKLMEGKTISIIVDYFDITHNSPKIKYIPIENFYVSNNTDYNEGLRKAHLVAERQIFSYWELKRKEKNKELENVDDVKLATEGVDSKDRSSKKKAEDKPYNIMEFTTYIKLKESDEEDTKVKLWYEETQRIFLGGILYPWFGFDSDYVAFYVKLNDDGFYGAAKSVLSDLKDSNIAQNALLNLYLHGVYVRNILTPVVREGSEMEAMFAEQRWTDGKPIPIDDTIEDVSKAYDFVQYPQINMGDLAVIDGMLKRNDSNVTSVSDYMTGRESPTDPSAPASKTIALLNQSGINIRDYIRAYIPSFNILVENILQLYYQMSQEGRKFRIGIKSKQVTGEDGFAEISRTQMAAKTTIQARASSFIFDKANEKQENMVMMQTLLTHPYAMQLPQLQFTSLKQFMRSWSPLWKNIADKDLPSPEQFQQSMLDITKQAIMQVMQAVQQKSQLTGVAAQPPSLEELSQVGQEARVNAFNPQLVAAKQKEAESAK